MYDHFVSLDVGLKKYIWVSTARTVNMCSIKSIPMQKRLPAKLNHHIALFPENGCHFFTTVIVLW